jgi:hypothetical protein
MFPPGVELVPVVGGTGIVRVKLIGFVDIEEDGLGVGFDHLANLG